MHLSKDLSCSMTKKQTCFLQNILYIQQGAQILNLHLFGNFLEKVVDKLSIEIYDFKSANFFCTVSNSSKLGLIVIIAKCR